MRQEMYKAKGGTILGSIAIAIIYRASISPHFPGFPVVA